MINSPTLAGQHILVTRPGEKGENLAAILEQHGAIACRFPLFEIVLQPDPSAFQTQWQSLNAVAIIIFVSIPSVDGFFDSKGMTRDRLFADFPEIAVAAVGPGTAQRLGEFGVETDYLPPSRFDSEGLLARLEDASVEGKQVVIVRGSNGRETLAQGLSCRGARVGYLQSYDRRLTEKAGQALPVLWLTARKRMAVITSVEAAIALVDNADVAQKKKILTTPLAVFSQRIVSRCRQLGFEEAIMVTDRPDSTSLVEALTRLAKLIQG